MKRAAVLGSPVAHSLSPVLHRAAYAELGLDWSYSAIECDEERLPTLVGELDGTWAGLSLTMPLKRAVLPLLDEVTELADAVGGANTVTFGRGRSRGDNTDVGGMVDALRERGVDRAASVVILGGGATASSALAALPALGCQHAAVVVREPARTEELRAAARRLGVAVDVHTFADLPALLPAGLLVSTLPAHSADAVADVAAQAAAVFDVCYVPWPTRLAQVADEAGCPVIGGFDLLLHQAVRQVILMTGFSDVPVAPMRVAGERALDLPHRRVTPY